MTGIGRILGLFAAKNVSSMKEAAVRIRQLIELLECYEEELGNGEVLLMTQQSWPFENTIKGVISRDSLDEGEEDMGHGEGKHSDIFLVEGTQLRYGTKKAWEVL